MKSDFEFLSRTKQEILTWIEKVREEGTPYGIYPFTAKGKVTLLSSCFAALARGLFKDLKNFDADSRHQWINYIQACQNKKGLFVDVQFKGSDLTGIAGGTSLPDNKYIFHQFTFFSYLALSALGAKPRYRFCFLEPFLDKAYLDSWLDKLNWKDPWRVSNEVMFIGCFLAWMWEDTQNKDYYNSVINLVNWLEKHLDPETGFWGTDKGAILKHGMAGAVHLYMFFYYINRDIPHKEKVIDNTLSLQEADGLFSWYGGGGACDDLDAVDILCNMAKFTDYRSEDIEQALKRVVRGMVENQRSDGGFCWAARPYPKRSLRPLIGAFNPLNRLGSLKRRWAFFQFQCQQFLTGKEMSYYSRWKLMPYVVNESDMWSGWFRPLTLALICRFFDSDKSKNLFEFAKKLGFGWQKN